MPEQYTRSEAVAWEFVQSSVGRGLSATAGLAEYRAGGGHIRTQDWYSIFRGAQDADYAAELSARLPDYLTVRSEAFQYTPWKMQEEFIAKAKVTVKDAYGNVYTDIWRTVESSENMTMKDWRDSVTQYLRNDKSIPDIQDVEISEMEFFTTGEWGTGFA